MTAGVMRAVRRGAVIVVASIAVAVGTAGCGIPPDDGPEALPLPPGIPSTTTSSPPPPATATGDLTATICLTRNTSLVAVLRPVETAPSPEDLLRYLVEGATPAEEEQELSSLLVGIQTLSVAGIQDRIVNIDIGDGLADIAGSTRLLIFGQIVCTLDADPEIVGVVFSRAGQQLTVPRGDGTQTQVGAVLTAEDYAELRESTATPTPTS